MDISLWVTTDCNLCCRYCYEGSNKLANYMTKDVVDQSIKYTFKYLKNIINDDFRVQIHGGEPFLAFDIIKYIVDRFKEEAKKRNLKVRFLTTTNLTIINDEIIEFIKREMPAISISLDGTEETHDNLRIFEGGMGSHNLVLKNANLLLDNSIQIRIRNTFDSKSVSNLYNDIKFMIDKGFKCIVSAPNLFDKDWDLEKIEILEEQIKKVKLYVGTRDDLLINLLDKNLFKKKGYCTGGQSNLNIYPDGSLYPCTIVTGNKEFCIGDVYNGVDLKKRDYLLSYSSLINSECEGCKIYNYCKGTRCKMINKLITNDYCKPSAVQCAIERLNYKLNKA
ncbi:radical SAM protein [Clostridioides difficile]